LLTNLSGDIRQAVNGSRRTIALDDIDETLGSHGRVGTSVTSTHSYLTVDGKLIDTTGKKQHSLLHFMCDSLPDASTSIHVTTFYRSAMPTSVAFRTLPKLDGNSDCADSLATLITGMATLA